jgi:hypothetical protein
VIDAEEIAEVKDDITFDVTGGSALGSYLNSSTNFALATNYGATGKYGSFNGPTTAAAAAAIIFEPTTEFGTEIGYQHWWFDNLRSTFSGGLLHHDLPVDLVGATQAGSMNKELITSHANLIWNPVRARILGVRLSGFLGAHDYGRDSLTNHAPPNLQPENAPACRGCYL